MRRTGLVKPGAAKDAGEPRSSGNPTMSVDTQAATSRLMRFLAIEGVTGKEAAIGLDLTSALM